MIPYHISLHTKLTHPHSSCEKKHDHTTKENTPISQEPSFISDELLELISVDSQN